MVSWDQAKGKQSTGSNQRREIERLPLAIGETKVRLIGEVMPRYCYWIVTKEGKKIRCLSNVCTHRGTIVCVKATKTKNLVCGYHGRQFHMEG